MALSRLQFRPGINRESTSYANEGGWYDMDKVRFRFGFPEKIGGWAKAYDFSVLGTCRALLPWTALTSTRYLGIGTDRKYYVYTGGGLGDITPVRYTSAAGSVTFTAFSNSLYDDITDTDTSIALSTSTTGYPPQGYVKIGSETVFYGSLGASSLENCVRGVGGTTAVAHTPTTAVKFSTLLVTDALHNAKSGDFVTFYGATSLGDQISDLVLNQEYEVFAVKDTNNYYVNARNVATIISITVDGVISPNYVGATASDTGDGGTTAYAEYQISIEKSSGYGGTGWGIGRWSRGTWGSGSPSAAQDIWSHDTYGEDLLLCVQNGGVYYWDTSAGIGVRAVALSSLPGANTTPTIAKQIMLSDKDRHIIAFGCDGEFTPGVQDPLLIRFSETESRVEWNALRTNTAGDLRLGIGTEIVRAIETKQEILVFTDVSLHSMQFIGPPYTFGINLIAASTTIMAPNAAVSADDFVYWMGKNQFYMYNGSVIEIPCTVLDYVFNDFNYEQNYKVFAATNKAFSEVWWFYPSSNSFENDRYVVFNYQQNLWYYGELNRTAWIDRGIFQYPLAASQDSYLYNQECGLDDGSTDPVSPVSAYIESSWSGINYERAQSLSDFVFISRVLPDITFGASTSSSPQVEVTVKTSNFPGGPVMQDDSQAVATTITSLITRYTEEIFTRLRGRSFSFRIASNDVGVTWRMGVPRIEMRTDGRR